MNNKKNDYTHETLRQFFIESENNKNKEKFFLGEKYEDGSREKPESQNYSNNIKLFEHIISTFALPDMTRRGNIPNAKEKLTKNGSLEELAKRINELLSSSTETFDEWHKKACNMLTTKNEDVNLKYGQAQKLVNMSLKYIYCLKDFNTNTEVADWHMTLDSYTLNWIAQHLYEPTGRGNQTELSDTINIKDLAKELSGCFSSSKDEFKDKSEEEIENIIKEKIKTLSKFVENIKWNNLDDNGYKFLQKMIKEFLDTDPPFIAEFYIWPQMQIELIETNIQKDMKTLTKYTEVISHLSVESDNTTHIHINDIEKKIDGFFANLKDSL